MADAIPHTPQDDDDNGGAWWLPFIYLLLFVLMALWVYDKVRDPGLLRTGGTYVGHADHGADGTDDHGGDHSADAAHTDSGHAADASAIINVAGDVTEANGGAGEVHSALETPPVAAALADEVTNVVQEPQTDTNGISLSFERQIGDFTLRGASGGVEDRLIAFIDSDRPICTDADCWFSFDRLTFTTGSANLDFQQSQDQLNNIVAILKAYPALELKFGGYTDNTGDEAFNYDLSDRRAKAVVAALIGRGIEAARLTSEGFGPEFPVASNETREGRALNRRVDVRVRAR